ncbi:hypothetical protein CSOJ01_06557 [Colletotrichum sojae]|uniref:Uncharacterized protein n=1 Tax=Colletotrichum sojae TaxID=2175907 RepID=A0A8H6MUZ5_9PEZI|nr:hypothetical protein CSOJ01_06557 [Colletotrichum sojae]
MAYNQHPSDSIDNAAYPYGDSSYSPGHHPSDSISNAAYPQNSSYQPSPPVARPDDKLAMPEARYSQSYNDGPSRSGPAATGSYRPHQPLGQFPSHGPPVVPWSPDGDAAANPNLPPPPPYVPSRPGTGTGPSTPRSDPISPVPSEQTLLGQQAARQQQPPAPAAAHVSAAPPHPAPGHANEERPGTYVQSMTGGMPAYGNQPAGLGPIALARRKKKLCILAGILCLVLLFLIAVVVGVLVALGKRKDDGPRGPPGPPRF